MAANFVDIVEEIGASLSLAPVHLSRGSFVENAISSSSLTYDLVTGGGFPPGRIILFKGFEASGKSTLCYSAINDAINNNTPCAFIDAEGSTDPFYLKRIGVDLDNVCGKKNNKGEWVTKPKLQFLQPDTGEQVFRFMHSVLGAMPDKMADTKGDNKWIYVNPKTGTQTKAESGIEGLFFVDSYAALLPEDAAEDPTKSPTAMQARMFSENLRLIKSLINKKHVTLIATNQMRMNPRCMFGNPKYMPGGEAVKHYCDARTELTRVSIPNGKGSIEEEFCWDGNGIDRYVYIKFYVEKNKCFSPFRESVLRIWFEERGMPGRGIDPVFDTWQYLEETGQGVLNDTGKKWQYTIKTPFVEDQMDWLSFKKMILDPANKSEFRQACRKQIEDSTAFELYFNHVGKVATTKDKVKQIFCATCSYLGECKKKYKIKESSPACQEYDAVEKDATKATEADSPEADDKE